MVLLICLLTASSAISYSAVELPNPLIRGDRPATFLASGHAVYIRRIAEPVITTYPPSFQVTLPRETWNQQLSFARSKGNIYGLTAWNFEDALPIAEVATTFIGVGGRLSELKPPANCEFVRATSINSAGSMSCTAFTLPDTSTGSKLFMGYAHKNGGYEDLFPGTAGSHATDINERGDIVGYRHLDGPRGFVRTGRNITQLTTEDGSDALALAINDYGTVVGINQSGTKVFLWKGAYRGVFRCPPQLSAQFIEINDRGTIAVSSGDDSSPAYLLNLGKFARIDSLLVTKRRYFVYRAISLSNDGNLLVLAKRNKQDVLLLLKRR